MAGVFLPFSVFLVSCGVCGCRSRVSPFSATCRGSWGSSSIFLGSCILVTVTDTSRVFVADTFEVLVQRSTSITMTINKASFHPRN